MSSSFTGNPNNFLQQNYIIPEDPEQKDLKLRQYLNEIATATNTKDSGIYDAIETITGQQFLPTFSTSTASNLNYRTVFRKVINFGALPNATSKSVAHGIDFGTVPGGTDFSGTTIYGSATRPGVSWIPLPFSSPTLNLNISLEITATNVVIITGVDRTAYTRSFVVIEYIKTI
jgi:hypothetical protein